MKTSYRERDYEFGEAMHKLRSAIGLTQGRLGNLLGVSWQSVAQWEAGNSYPKTERLKALIELGVQHQAFSTGSEAQEIRRLWKVAHQKELLDEHWLSVLLDQQSRPQGQALWPQPRVEPEPVEDTITTAPEPVDEESTEPRTPSDQPTLVRSSYLTGLDAVACQSQGQSHELPRAASNSLVLEAETADAPSPLPVKSFPQTPLGTRADRPRRKLLIGILIALVIVTITGLVGIFLFHITPPQAHPYPGYLPGNGALAFFDPLREARESQWPSYSNKDTTTGGACQFTGGAYHVSQAVNGYFTLCTTTRVFSNFAFEVQLTITQGDCGGIAFRLKKFEHYDFSICQNGESCITKFVSVSSSDAQSLYCCTSSAVHTGLGHQNKLAVVANGSTMTFYVNEQQIDQEQDSSYTSGKIALTANPFYNKDAHATEVAYSNARLWTL
jgi:transcriptional regulator with XRE-family HTH domain